MLGASGFRAQGLAGWYLESRASGWGLPLGFKSLGSGV